ncbi:MAG: elongator complex protein 3, partial [Acetanaerobacterium sp.]
AVFVPHIGCPHRCVFCDQRAISGATKAPTPADVRKACEIAQKSLGERVRDAEIAFFGGSFTAIDRAYMTALLREAHACIGEMGFMGIRCSTRPDAVDDEVLALLEQYGVTSVELGAQSMDDEVLRKNERGHTARDVYDASQRIREHGFSLGLQMMAGLYGDTPEKTLATARAICTIKPDTVRIYPAIVMQDTALARLYREGEYTPLTLDEAVEICAQCLVLFAQNGVRVIRVGLHSSVDLQKNMVAGPFHPAFHELCQSHLWLARLLDELCAQDIACGDVTARVNPRNLSKLLGQRKKNVEILTGMHYNLTVYTDASLDLGALVVLRGR